MAGRVGLGVDAVVVDLRPEAEVERAFGGAARGVNLDDVLVQERGEKGDADAVVVGGRL
jgi:hypothetical protein